MARTARKKVAAKRKRKPAALAPRTGKPEPEAHRVNVISLPARSAGVRVTEDTALTLGAVWACVKVISEDLAGLPWHVHERRAGGGSDMRPDDPADWLLHTQGSPETPAFQWREAILAHALLWGNGYAEIERDGAGRPAWLWLITPDRVTPFRDGGQIWYEVQNPQGGPTYLPAEDTYHLRGLGFDGLVGYSVIQFAARSIGAGIALDQSTADLFGNDSTPGGLLKHPGRLSDTARTNLQSSWERRHQGPTNRRRVAILEEGMSWEQTGLPPEDTKLIEQRQFTPSDIARWFRVKPHKIADLSRSTFSNIEHQGIEHVTDTLLPWARRLETEANIKLFGRTNRGRRFSKLNFHGLLRGDTAAQTSHIKEMLGWGVYDVNESREYLDLNPIGADGDKRFVPLNMQLLEKAGEEPDPPPEPPTPPGEEMPPDEMPEDEEDEEEEMPAENMAATVRAELKAELDSRPMPSFSLNLPEQKPPVVHNNNTVNVPEQLPANVQVNAQVVPPSEPRREASEVLRPVFEDACRRLLMREHDRARAALTGGDLGGYFDKNCADHVTYVRSTLRPAVAALAIARGGTPERLEAALSVVADRHLEGFRTRLLACKADTPPAWEGLAGELAANLIEQLNAAVEVSR